MNNKIAYLEPADILLSINVTDLKKAEKFWVEDLGFQRGWDKGLKDGWLEIEMHVKGLIIGLNRVKEEEFVKEETRINIAVKDIEIAKEFLEKKGIKTTKIRTIPRILKIMAVFDPDENAISLVEGLEKYRI
ncbi:MAG: VOC family protein [Candidatus Heimdallarchaeota archaeon]|nr:VOC family protein [Candidatus Heimdallarchaeota archaeon]MCK4611821.1 VOC family protein [Candidatus Heimdallarchaeota archaeon]